VKSSSVVSFRSTASATYADPVGGVGGLPRGRAGAGRGSDSADSGEFRIARPGIFLYSVLYTQASVSYTSAQ